MPLSFLVFCFQLKTSDFLLPRRVGISQKKIQRAKTAPLVLPIAEYERLMEDLGDYAVIADRLKEPTISHEQFVSELKQDGILPS
jgi:hypothetical protein